MSYLTEDWSRLTRWLSEHAPRTRASLLPAVQAEAVRNVAAKHGLEAPPALVKLYGLAGGQRLDLAEQRRGGAQGIFDGFWFMTLDGVDGVDQALADFAEARAAGADWAKTNRFPFAKDFGGAYLVLEEPTEDDDHVEAKVLKVGDCEEEEMCSSIETLITVAWENLECGLWKIDERYEERDKKVVLFDATRPRKVGESAKHSVFDALGIRATIVDLSEAFGMFDKKPGELFGLAARLGSEGEIAIDDVALVDADDQRLPARTGHGSGGGKPGVLVFVWDRKQLRSGSRLRVTLSSIRRA
jgi:cell wall assembly regulator SMI1